MWVKQDRLPRTIVTALVLVCLFAIGLSGCSTQPSGEIEVRVIVTQEFGSELMLDESITVSEGSNAMDALKQVAEIETAYGGGFVNAINGVRSGYTGSHSTKKDWFIIANGILTNTGTLDYTMHPGDIERWDFHNWSFSHFIPAIIGHFPEPFLHGYEEKSAPPLLYTRVI